MNQPTIQALDDALHSLASRSSGERIDVLRRLAEHWRGPLAASDGCSPDDLAPLRLPDTLRRWLLVGGRLCESFCTHNELLGVSSSQPLYETDGKLVFYVENQGLWEMATLPTGDDPPVWSRHHGEGEVWTEEPASLSIQLIHAFLFEAVMQAAVGASTDRATAEVLALVEGNLRELPYSGWGLMDGRTRFFASGGAFAVVMPAEAGEGDRCTIHLGAKTEEPLRFLRQSDRDVWDAATF